MGLKKQLMLFYHGVDRKRSKPEGLCQECPHGDRSVRVVSLKLETEDMMSKRWKWKRQ